MQTASCYYCYQLLYSPLIILNELCRRCCNVFISGCSALFSPLIQQHLIRLT